MLCTLLTSIDQGSAAFFAFNMLLLVQTVTLSRCVRTPLPPQHLSMLCSYLHDAGVALGFSNPTNLAYGPRQRTHSPTEPCPHVHYWTTFSPKLTPLCMRASFHVRVFSPLLLS